MKVWHITLVFILLVALTSITSSFATPTEEVTPKGSDQYDDWNVARTRPYGEDGYFQRVSIREFRPVIVFESLGKYEDVAYELGERFAEQYPDRQQCAEQIFYFVRDHVRYTSDVDKHGLEEFAENADELVHAIESQGYSRGDCEDMAILLAVMYKGAGFRSAIVEAPGHAATMVHLPSYKKANIDWSFRGESGWIWAEATGRNNPLGWTPENLINKEKRFYEVTVEEPELRKPPFTNAVYVEEENSGGTFIPSASPFFLILLMMFLLSTLGRRGRGKRRRRSR